MFLVHLNFLNQAFSFEEEAVVGTWSRTFVDPRSKPSKADPEFYTIKLDKNGAYDSGGFFGFGKWRRDSSRISLVMANSFFSTLPQVFQNYHAFSKTGKFPDYTQPIYLDIEGNKLSFRGDPGYSRGPKPSLYERRASPLRLSARSIYARKQSSHPR